jgi:Holliday junction resolvase RusA-like endonuclease
MRNSDRDVDNIIKPILDAGNRVIYQDDKQVVEVCSQKISRDLDRGVEANAAIVAAMQASDGEFVYISYRHADE